MTHQIKEGYTCIYWFMSKNVCKPFGSELKLLNSVFSKWISSETLTLRQCC